jgi:hypothetical protein
LKDFKDWLEIIYFLCGPVVVLIAYLALEQIKVSKQQLIEQKRMLHIASKRDSLKLTSEQIASYLDKVIPLANSLNAKLVSENITILDEFSVEFFSGSIQLTPPEKNLNSSLKFNCFTREFVNLLNAMESFSTFFMSGVADERVAYLSLGSTFCSSMKTLAPILIPLGKNSGAYPSAIGLYHIWGSRRETESLEIQKKEIEDKINNKNITSINVIGISDDD